MSVWLKVRGFFQRHRNKLIISGVIITGSILLTRYAQRKLREWQEQQTREFLERTRKQQYFESTERTCNQTILSLLSPLLESLSKVIDTDVILEEIRNNPQNKLKLWEELKVKVFTKVTCFIYIFVMLTVTVRVQLSILGGYLYKNSNSVSSDIQERYLHLCRNLLDTGVLKLSAAFEKEYSKILGPISLKKCLKLVDLEKIFWEIQTAAKNSIIDPVERMKEYVVINDNNFKSEVYDSLVRDTVDILESDEIKSLATSCINRGFILLGDRIAEFYGPGQKSKNESNSKSNVFVHPSHVEVALAKLIPIVSGLMTKTSFPDNFLQQLANNDKLKVLSANIYEAFSNSE